MKNKPLITIIITNYNYGEYVGKAIESVFTQTYPNIELVIINDGSTDDSDNVIKQAIVKNPERNVRYINRENKGVVYTRNEGIEVASGDYICYLDADDYFNRDYISKSYRIAKDYDADVVYPNWHFVGDWLGRPDTDFPEFTSKLLQLQKLHCTPASLMSKKAIDKHRFEVEKVAEDWDFFIGLSLDGVRFKLAKDNYINYRIRKGTRGSQNDPKEDTLCFVEILNKYRAVYGNEVVVDPKRLTRLRHPNLVMRVMNTRHPRRIIESVKKDGARATTRKVIKKLASKNKMAWKAVWYARNKRYQMIINSLNIQKSPKAKLAVVIHLYHRDLWPTFREKLVNIDVSFDLFISVQMKDRDITLEKVSKYHGVTNIIGLPNRGRDVLPFMIIADIISEAGQYEYLLKLHSKKSLHRADGGEWLSSLLDQLIPPDVSHILKTLKKKDTGVVGPADHVASLSRYMGDNRDRIKTIVDLIVGDNSDIAKRVFKSPSRYPFFGGTMLWCRVDFLKPLLDCDITPADFNTESGQVDGTTAHAIERILGKTLHVIGNKKMYIVNNSIVNELPDKAYTAKYKYVEQSKIRP